MPQRICRRHGRDYPCTCAMGNLYRFVEPVVLLLLKKKGRSYGYDLSGALDGHAMTDAEIERAALYRTLRRLEKNGNVASEWETETGGPARRIYRLTERGQEHLVEWAAVLDHVSKSMSRFVREARKLEAPAAPSLRDGAPVPAKRSRRHSAA
jgi:PadR family transcriptional regulator, regulatory protein PadR